MWFRSNLESFHCLFSVSAFICSCTVSSSFFHFKNLRWIESRRWSNPTLAGIQIQHAVSAFLLSKKDISSFVFWVPCKAHLWVSYLALINKVFTQSVVNLIQISHKWVHLKIHTPSMVHLSKIFPRESSTRCAWSSPFSIHTFFFILVFIITVG